MLLILARLSNSRLLNHINSGVTSGFESQVGYQARMSPSVRKPRRRRNTQSSTGESPLASSSPLSVKENVEPGASKSTNCSPATTAHRKSTLQQQQWKVSELPCLFAKICSSILNSSSFFSEIRSFQVGYRGDLSKNSLKSVYS